MAAGMDESGTGMTTSACDAGSHGPAARPGSGAPGARCARPRSCRGGRSRCARRCSSASGLAGGSACWTRQGVVAQGDDLAGLDLADGLRSPGCAARPVSEASGMPAAGQHAHAQRAEAPRVAHRKDAVAGQDHQRVGALPLRHGIADALHPGVALRPGQHHRDHFGIGGGRQAHPALQQFLAQFGGIDQVAVVRHRQRPVLRLDQEGLGVARRARSRWWNSACARWHNDPAAEPGSAG